MPVPHPYQRRMMAYYKMGPGPYYVFYRPYHLCHVEAMACVADAVLDGRSLLEPRCGFRTNVFCHAKHDLPAGTILDGIGGYHAYGQIENCPTAGEADGLPIRFAEAVRLLRPVAKGQRIALANVACPHERADFQLYRGAPHNAIPS